MVVPIVVKEKIVGDGFPVPWEAVCLPCNEKSPAAGGGGDIKEEREKKLV